MSSVPAIKTRSALAAGAVALLLLSMALGWKPVGSSSATLSPLAGAPASLPALPEPAPQVVKPLSPQEAKAANDALPLVINGVELAAAFGGLDQLEDPIAYKAALDCLTSAVYYEAASEAEQGQRAVAQVVLNRVRHPAFPANICDVVYQGSERTTGCQFTFTCDGSLRRRPSRTGWDRARRIAEHALAGGGEPSVGMATHYHTNWVQPYWAPDLDKIAAVGSHIFYRWKGFWGRRSAFRQLYAGGATTELASAIVDQVVAVDLAPSVVGNPQSAFGPRAGAKEPAENWVIEDEAVRSLTADEATERLVIDDNEFRLMTHDSSESGL